MTFLLKLTFKKVATYFPILASMLSFRRSLYIFTYNSVPLFTGWGVRNVEKCPAVFLLIPTSGTLENPQRVLFLFVTGLECWGALHIILMLNLCPYSGLYLSMFCQALLLVKLDGSTNQSRAEKGTILYTLWVKNLVSRVCNKYLKWVLN